MQLSPMAWNPVSIQFDAADTLDANTMGVVTFRGNLRPGATDAGSFVFKAWQRGAIVDERRLEGRVSPAERAKLQAVRDALLGSDFLRRATVVSSVTSLPVGSLRITVADADGTRRAYTMAADQDPPASMQRLDSAMEAWSALAFPQLGGASLASQPAA